MANRFLRQFVLSQDPKQVLIAGNISLSAAAAVSSSSFNSLVSSVAKSATGTYTITLSDKYQLLRSCNVSFEGTDATISAFISSTDVSGAKTIVIKTALAGVVADVTSATKLHVSLVLKDSTAR
jgi:hypothetical protein